MIKINIKEYFEIKNTHKDIILNSSSALNEFESKDKIFKTDDEYIYIGEKKYFIEDFLLGKIPLTDDLILSLENELDVIKNKFIYYIKRKKDIINEIDYKIKVIDELINEVMSNKNDKVLDVLNVISNSYKNIISSSIVHADNLLCKNNNYMFFNGERTILNKKDYSTNEISTNYKIEINISRSYLSYIVFNDILKTLDTFKIYFIDGNTQVGFIKEFNLKDKYVELNNNCTKIIVEGVGANEICNDIKICVGKNQTNMNRGVAVIDCDFSKVKISDLYHISAHEDVRIFLWKKTDVDFLLPYKDFKQRYYLLEKLVDTNQSTFVNLIDNYLVVFVETNYPVINKIKVYGVDS